MRLLLHLLCGPIARTEFVAHVVVTPGGSSLQLDSRGYIGMMDKKMEATMGFYRVLGV